MRPWWSRCGKMCFDMGLPILRYLAQASAAERDGVRGGGGGGESALLGGHYTTREIGSLRSVNPLLHPSEEIRDYSDFPPL